MIYIKRILFCVVLLFPATLLANPEIQHWTTEKGARVYLVETHELPMVDIELVFAAGSSRDGNQPGLALMTNGLLSEGAGGKTVDEISRGFEDLGAQFGNTAGKDTASLSLRSLVEESLLTPALNYLRLVLSKPDFPAQAFERERDRALVSIRQKQQSPGSLAGDAFNKAIYGDHPYAQPEEGTEASLLAMQLTDLKNFYREYYVAKNLTVAIVGDLDRKQAEELVDKLLAELPSGRKAPPLPEVKPLTEDKLIRITHPSQQTHLLIGQPGIRRTDPDLFPLYVGNHILGGGGLVSRLFEEIREKRGLSYSSYSYFMPMQQRGPFIAGLQTRAEQAMEARDIVFREIKRFIKEGPTEEELKATKQNLTGGFPLRVDSNSDILGYLALIGFYELPLDYLDTYNQKVEQVTATQIKEAFARKLQPENMVTIMVGPETNLADGGDSK